MTIPIIVYTLYTVEPPNKGHTGDNKNSAGLSSIERLSSFRGSQCIETMGKVHVNLEWCPL